MTLFGCALVAIALGSDYRDLLHQADALAAEGKFVDAASAYRAALEEFDADGQVWLQYGLLCSRTDQPEEVIRAADKVLLLGATGANVRPTAHYEKACALATLGRTKEAWQSLEQAMNAGYRNLANLQTDPRLEPLHSFEGWEELSATRDVSKLSRDEGWRYDAWLLDRELRRIHFDPYARHTPAERDAQRQRLLDGIPDWTDDEIVVEFLRYVASFGDGHTRLAVPNLRRPAIQIFWFEEGMIVTTAEPDLAELVGSRLIAVEGHQVESLVPLVEPLIARDNPQGLKVAVPNFVTNATVLRGLGKTEATESLRCEFLMPDGSVAERDLKLVQDFAPKPDWARSPRSAELATLKNRTQNYWFELMPDLDAVYVQYNAVFNAPGETIAEFAKRLFASIDAEKPEHVILDVRWNGGGNTFLSEPLIRGLLERPVISQEGKLFVIADRNTFSAAQNFVTDLERSCRPIFVGEPTGSSPNFVGESIPYALPYSRITGTVSDLYWQRSWPMDERVWIAPELPALPSWEAFHGGKDPALEAIGRALTGK